MSDVANLVGKLSVDTTEAVRSVNQLTKATDQAGAGFGDLGGRAGKAIDGVQSAFKRMNEMLSTINSVAAGFSTVYQGVLKGFDLAIGARQMEALKSSLPTGALQGLKHATEGLVSEMELSRLAARGMTGDFALTQSQMETTLQAAQALAQRGIGDFNSNAEKMLDGLAKGVNKLDDLGIALEKTGDRQHDVNAAMEKFAEITHNTAPIDEHTAELIRAKNAWKELGEEIHVAAGKLAEFAMAGPEVADYARHRGDKRMNIAETATSMKNWAYIDAFKDSVSERVSAQFEAARANRPAGWYDDVTGDLYLATRSFGRAVGRNYDKALDRARSPGEYQGAREAVGMRQTYGMEYFEQTAAGSLRDDDRLTRDIAAYDAAQKRAVDGFAMTGEGLDDQIEKAAEASKKIDFAEAAAELDVYGQAANLAADAMWNLGDALLNGSGSATAFLKDLARGVAGMGKDAFFKSIYFLAEGWAFPTKRAESFAAAKFYATAAALAIPTAAALGGLAASGGGGGAGAASAHVGGSPASIGGSSGGSGASTIIVNVSGVIGEPAEVGRIINNAITSAQRTGRSSGNRAIGYH